MPTKSSYLQYDIPTYGDTRWDLIMIPTLTALDTETERVGGDRLVTADSLTAGNSVSLKTNGQLQTAKIDSAAIQPLDGFAIETVAAASMVRIQSSGKVTNAAWNFTDLGKLVYLSNTGGSVAQTPSFDDTKGVYQIVGRARSATSILAHPELPIFPIHSENGGNPVQFKDGSSNPTNNFVLAWNNTDKAAYNTITFDGNGQDIHLIFSFYVGSDLLKFPGSGFACFRVRYKTSGSANRAFSVDEIVRPDGTTITTGLPSAGTSTTIANFNVPGTAFTGSIGSHGVVSVRCKAAGDNTDTVSIENVACLSYAPARE